MYKPDCCPLSVCRHGRQIALPRRSGKASLAVNQWRCGEEERTGSGPRCAWCRKRAPDAASSQPGLQASGPRHQQADALDARLSVADRLDQGQPAGANQMAAVCPKMAAVCPKQNIAAFALDGQPENAGSAGHPHAAWRNDAQRRIVGQADIVVMILRVHCRLLFFLV